MRTIKTLFGVLALTCAGSLQGGVQAAVITDTVKSDLSVTITYNGGSISTGAGPFDVTISGVPGFQSMTHFDAYCVDLTHYLQSTEIVTPLFANPSLQNGAQLAYLYNTFAPTVGTDQVKGAALQLSIWETEYDYNPLSTSSNKGLDFGSGNFQFISTSNSTQYTPVLNQANADINSLLANGLNYTGNAAYLNALHNGSYNQSLIGPYGAVPEPGVVSLAASCLIGVSAFTYRRRRQSK